MRCKPSESPCTAWASVLNPSASRPSPTGALRAALTRTPPERAHGREQPNSQRLKKEGPGASSRARDRPNPHQGVSAGTLAAMSGLKPCKSLNALGLQGLATTVDGGLRCCCRGGSPATIRRSWWRAPRASEERVHGIRWLRRECRPRHSERGVGTPRGVAQCDHRRPDDGVSSVRADRRAPHLGSRLDHRDAGSRPRRHGAEHGWCYRHEGNRRIEAGRCCRPDSHSVGTMRCLLQRLKNSPGRSCSKFGMLRFATAMLYSSHRRDLRWHAGGRASLSRRTFALSSPMPWTRPSSASSKRLIRAFCG